MSSEKAFTILVTRIRKADSLPSIMPIPKPLYGNKISFSENKSRRTWKPNLIQRSWPITVLGGKEAHTVVPMRRTPKIEMRVKDMRRIERAGGLEAMLVSCAYFRESPPVSPLHHASKVCTALTILLQWCFDVMLYSSANLANNSPFW